MKIEAIYDSTGYFSEGYAPVVRNDVCSLIDYEGNEVLRTNYFWLREFQCGLAMFSQNNRFGFINKIGSEVIQAKFLRCYAFRENRAVISKVYRAFAQLTGHNSTTKKIDQMAAC
ncbi:WG repeat-containing protein [Paenibacillus sp. DLE-14]|uniref:WG repeat-containing protein n=1 Tax=Paenibacillus lignilyticus TaxID=1172615 RepID=A0ABS5CAY0_9BACL|nr:WG repeat-containing protein [Paenibacillus lignilyticus]